MTNCRENKFKEIPNVPSSLQTVKILGIVGFQLVSITLTPGVGDNRISVDTRTS